MKKFQNKLQNEKRMGASEVQAAPERAAEALQCWQRRLHRLEFCLHTMERELSYWFITMLSVCWSVPLSTQQMQLVLLSQKQTLLTSSICFDKTMLDLH